MMFLVLRGGCAARHPYPFYLSRKYGVPNYVLLLLRSAGEFRIGETHFSGLPGHAVLIAPETPYQYHNPSGEYMDDWLHFEYVPETENSGAALKKEPPFPPAGRLLPVRSPEVLSSLIRQLLWEKSYTPSACLAENTDALFLILFNHLRFDCSPPESLPAAVPFQDQLRMLRLSLQNSPEQEHSIARCAAELKISESYFQHLYRRLFGISFQKDLIRLRLEHSMELLDSTEFTIEQLAAVCGYRSEVHFYRQFKAAAGCTPAQYRRRHEKTDKKGRRKDNIV